MPQTSLATWLKPKQSSSCKTPGNLRINTPVTDLTKNVEITTNLENAEQNVGENDTNIKPEASSTGPVITIQIPSNAQVVPVTDILLADFRRLVAVLLPIPYRDHFYTDILNEPVTAAITLAALWRDDPASPPKLVAGIRCRLLDKCEAAIQDDEVKGKPCLYIAAIGTLAPFRNYGIASALLAQVTAVAAQEYGARTVVAHVWESNEEARAWYAKLGFEEVSFEPAYYRRLKPAGAHVVLRVVRPSDLLRKVSITPENS